MIFLGEDAKESSSVSERRRSDASTGPASGGTRLKIRIEIQWDVIRGTRVERSSSVLLITLLMRKRCLLCSWVRRHILSLEGWQAGLRGSWRNSPSRPGLRQTGAGAMGLFCRT